MTDQPRELTREERAVLRAAMRDSSTLVAKGRIVQCVNCGGTLAAHPLDPEWKGRCECAAAIRALRGGTP